MNLHLVNGEMRLSIKLKSNFNGHFEHMCNVSNRMRYDVAVAKGEICVSFQIRGDVAIINHKMRGNF